MIVVDVNLLIYAVKSGRSVPSASEILAGIRGFRNRDGGIALDRSSCVYPIDNKGRALFSAVGAEPAFDLVDLRDLIVPLGTGGNLTSDAHLTALAIEHRLRRFCSRNIKSTDDRPKFG
jgi:predicted nucleic acid-binding protein